MSKRTWTRRLRQVLCALLTGVSCFGGANAMAQTNQMRGDSGGIELAPGEKIIESVDSATGQPVPIFDANNNQPITTSPNAGSTPSPTHGPSYSMPGDFHSNCFAGCDPGYYFGAETLFMRRQGNRQTTITPKFALDEFDFELGSRFTLGYMTDCIEGYEVTFSGLLEWDMAGQRATDPTITPNTLLSAGPDIGPGFLDVFTNAEFQRQSYDASYNSLEFNRTDTGWDVVRLLYGLRYIRYDEDFRYSVLDPDGPINGATAGGLRSDVDNNMVGGQVGIDMAYPLSERCWSLTRARGGVFANFVDSHYQIATNAGGGTNVVNNQDETTDLSGMIEIGTSFRYRLGRSLALTGGYELWYLVNVASAPDQLSRVVRRTNGVNVAVGDDVFMHGLTFGVDFSY